MLKFKVIEKLKTNKDLTDILKDFKYKVKLGQIKTILHTNLHLIQFSLQELLDYVLLIFCYIQYY